MHTMNSGSVFYVSFNVNSLKPHRPNPEYGKNDLNFLILLLFGASKRFSEGLPAVAKPF